MIPMDITPEMYAEYFPPAPDYLLVERIPINYEKLGAVYVPQKILDASQVFVTVGKILAVSEFASADEFVERMKAIFKEREYVSFNFHVTADISLMPQFKLPERSSIVLLHVKDAVQMPHNVKFLLKLHEEFEKQEAEKTKNALTLISQERQRIVGLGK